MEGRTDLCIQFALPSSSEPNVSCRHLWRTALFEADLPALRALSTSMRRAVLPVPAECQAREAVQGENAGRAREATSPSVFSWVVLCHVLVTMATRDAGADYPKTMRSGLFLHEPYCGKAVTASSS